MTRTISNREPGGSTLRWALGAAVRLTLLLLLLFSAGIGIAEGQRHQDRPGAREAEQAIAQLRSPYCPGLMLEVCPSPDAAALRDTLYERAARGATSEELVSWMLGRYGEEWRGVPQRTGAGLWAWLIPPLALLVGVGAVAGWLRSHRNDAPAAEGAGSMVSAGDRERIAAALRRWEESGREEGP